MKFFLDTANIEEIRKANDMGVLDGITTNPTLLSKEGKDPVKVVKEICSIVDGPVNAEVISTDTDGMLREGYKWAELDKKIVVKIPMTRDGMKAVKKLKKDGIRTNVTLIFSPTQALIAAKAGASYVSPFVGRLDDRSEDGMQLAEQIVHIYANYGFETEVLVASVRHPIHVVQAALLGADIATMPYAVFEKLFDHPLTDLGLQQFLADWKKLQK
ncbi:fructose-6-phosphate aldolase [Candidatus Acetothermia bacterium]|nr:fructose-6-phosphate aldolase [Candidatus Acetothermia bacterium]MBI3660448.1 fructose-6-phosphate aldolase [Candidatus Acetothermia bacterium]